MASEIGKMKGIEEEKQENRVEKIPYSERNFGKIRVNSYMKCGWKKVEPPTQDKRNFT